MFNLVSPLILRRLHGLEGGSTLVGDRENTTFPGRRRGDIYGRACVVTSCASRIYLCVGRPRTVVQNPSHTSCLLLFCGSTACRDHYIFASICSFTLSGLSLSFAPLINGFGCDLYGGNCLSALKNSEGEERR